jgi:uncharacterized protein (TIGR03083 family)
MKTREELLREIHDEQASWQALLDEVGEDRMDEPGPMGDWTFKDLAAHLLFWQERMFDRMEAGPDGDPPAPWPTELGDEDEDDNWEEINAWIREQHIERPLSDVLADVDRSFERFAELIATMPEEDLMTPGRYAAMGDKALIETDFFGHLHEEHEPSVREWLQSR